MARKFKGLTVFTGMLICLFMATMSVSAADNIVLSADVERVDKGGEVLVSIDLGEDAALYAYVAKLSYDQKVFEPIEKNSFQAQENWSDIVYNSGNNKFGLINKAGESGSDVLEIKFKVKDDAKAGTTSITVDNVSVSDGGAAQEIKGASVDIYVMENALDDTEATDASAEIIDGNMSVPSGTDNTWLGILFAVLTVLVASFAVMFFIKTRDTKKRIISTLICAVLAVGLILGAVRSFTSRQPDVNGDGKVDYDDAKDVLECLLEIDKGEDSSGQEMHAPDADNSESSDDDSSGTSSGSDTSRGTDSDTGGTNKPDVNNDGKVDVGDIGGIVDNAGRDTEYRAKIGKLEITAQGGQDIELIDNIYYIQKGEKNITVGFEATVNPHTLIKQVVIDGKTYPVTATKINKTRYHYMASVPAPSTAGEKTCIALSKIVLDNGKKLDASGGLSVEVLKDKLTLSNYTFSESGNDYKISFDISDPDGSLVSGAVIVRGENGESIEAVPNDIKAGKNEIILKGIRPKVKYTVVANAKYDLDSEKDNGAHEGLEILLTKQVEAIDYSFEMKDASVSIDKDNRKAVIEFESTVAVDGRRVDKVIINSETYAAKRVGSTNRYTVEIPYEDESEAIYKITGVILDNEVRLDMEQTIELATFRKAPTADSLKLNYNKANGTIDLSWSFKDEGSTVSAVYAILKRNGSVLETKKLSTRDTSTSFELEKDKYAGEYTVEIAADFDLVDGQSHGSEVLTSENIAIAIEASVRGFEVSKQYPAKGETIDLSFEIQSNTAENATTAVVNGRQYKVSYGEDGRYSLKYTVSDKAGLETIKLEEIKFSAASVYMSMETAVDVLRDKPVVNNLVYDDSEDMHIVSFTIDDRDDTFVKGELTVTNEKGEKAETIVLGGESKDYKFELKLKENGVYHISVSVTYDLDSNKQNSDNQAAAILAERDIEALVDYRFTFSDAQVKSIDNESKAVTITFKSTNASKDYGVSRVVINGIEYDVRRDGDDYAVVALLDSAARTELTITKAILEDQRSFDIDPSETGFIVFRNHPAAELELSAGRTSVDLSYNILDNDKTIRGLVIELKDSTGKAAVSKTIDEPDKYISGKVTFSDLTAGEYTAEMHASFDAADGLEHRGEVIGAKKAVIETAAQITNSNFDRKYVNKNEEISISYTIDKNTDDEPTALTINGNDCPLTKRGDNVYTVDYTAGDKAGREDISVTAVKFGDVSISAEYINSTEVLKSVPTISGLDYNGSENPGVSFTVNDDDDAFISGSIVVTGEGGYEKNIPVEKDKSTYELGIEDNGIYNVSVSVTYDLDSDRHNGLNRATKELVSKKIEVLVKYKFTFTNAKIKSVDYDNKIVTIGFKSTNASIFKVEKITVNGAEYDAVADGDSYTVKIRLDSTDRTELRITKAELKNHKAFDVSADFVVFKKAPVAFINAITRGNRIDVSYIIVDQDAIAEDVKVVLKTLDGREYESRSVSETEGTVTFIAQAGAYIVDITASYDAVDGRNHSDEILVSDDVIMPVSIDSISGKTDKSYVNKGEMVEIIYTVEDNTYEEIKSFTINGKDYAAEKQGDNTYKVSYKAGSDSGVEKIDVTAVNYLTETITAECGNVIEILKDTPTITGFDYSGSEKAVVSFNLNDPDSAFISGTITATDSEGNKTEYDVEKEKDSYDLGLKKNGTYSISINVTYDLDSDRDDMQNQKTEELYSVEIQILVDYKFRFDNAEVKSVDYESKTVELTFDSTNASVYPVAKVTVNGCEYDAQRNGSSYTVKVTLDSREKTTLNITDIELENHKRFSVSASLVVFRKAPGATLNIIPGEDKIYVGYVVIDNEGIAENLKLVLCDVYGEPIEAKKIMGRSVEGSAEFAIEKAGTYIVKLTASYDAVDGRQHVDEELASDDIVFAIDIDSITGKISKDYAEKNEKFDITYTVEDNTYEEIASFTIGGKEYPAEKLGDNEYRINYTAGDKAGVENIDVTAVNYDNESVGVSCSNKLEVLSDTPTIEGIIFDGSGAPKLSFKLNDPDGTFVSGTIKITGTNGFEKEIPVIKLVEDYDLGITKNGFYNVSINITYDRDSNKEDARHQTSAELASGEIQVIIDYEFKFTNAKIKSVDNAKKTVTITFESTNASMYNIAKLTINGKEYEPQVNGNTYTVTVGLDNCDRTELKITQAELENKTTFELDQTFVVFRNAPTGVLETTASDDVIHASYTIIDDEQIAEGIRLVLRDANGEVLGSIPCQELTGEGDFTVENAGAYTVELIASYDAADGLTHKDEALKSNTVELGIDVDSVTGEIAKKYFEKKENVEIFYTVEDNTYEDAATFTINGREYKAEKQNDGRYKISYTAKDSAGVEKLELTALSYSNETVDVNCKNSIEVLKDAPTVTDMDYNGSQKAVVSFRLNDPDDAFISGTIVVVGTDGVIKEIPVEKDREIYDLGLTKNGVYTVSVKVCYDRDSDSADLENQTERELHSGTIQVFVDYEFTFTNPVLKSVDNKTKTVTIGFESTNASMYHVEKVYINDIAYNVDKLGNFYTVSVPLDKAERTVLNITEVELGDHRRFDASGSFTVFKDKPSAQLTAEKSGNIINIDYTITDEDNTITGANVVLRNANGAVVESAACSGLSGSASLEIKNAGSYTVELQASFDAVDGLTHADETIAQADVIYEIEVKSVTSSVNNKYINKNDNAEIFYKVEDNTYEEVSAFIIGGSEYAAEKQDNGSYKVSYPVGDKAGEQTLKLTAVKYSGAEVSADNTTQIEVLKDGPTITGFDYDGSDEPTLSFKLNDADNAFISGKISVKDTDNIEVASINVEKGRESYVLDIDKNGVYSISISVNYDLDSKMGDGENSYDRELLNQTVQVFVNYGFKFTGLTFKSADTANSTVTLAFESTNLSMYKISKVMINGSEYGVTKQSGNTYTVDVKLDSNNRTVLLLTKAELEDHKKFDVNEKITVFKNEPSATLSAESGEDGISVSYEIADSDAAVKDSTIVLKDSEDRVISSQSGAENKDTVLFDEAPSGAYKIELTVNYDLVDGNGIVSRMLASQEITVAVKASITSSRIESEYVQKGAEVGIFYMITDNTDEPVVSLTINGADYPAVQQDNGEYRVAYVAGSKAGDESIDLSAIKYPSGTADAELTDSVEVLKDKPSADIVFDNSGDQPKLTVNLTDNDGASVKSEAYVVLTGADTEVGLEKKITVDLTRGENNIDISSLENNQKYVVYVSIDYDLDKDRGNGANNDKLIQNADLVIIRDYSFALSGLAVENIDSDKKEAELSFESANISSVHFVKSVVINDETYEVIKVSQIKDRDPENTYKYTVAVPYEGEKRQEFKLTRAMLDNMKSFNVTNQTAVIFKTAPTAEDIDLKLSEQDIFSVSFNTNDDDHTLKALNATLTDYKGEEIEIVSVDTEGTVHNAAFRSFDIHAGTYKVDITADYELVDGHGEYESQSLGTASYNVKIKIDKVSAQPEKQYVGKGEQVEITYTITDNTSYYVKNFEIVSTIDGKDTTSLYEVTKVSESGDESVYKVKATVPDRAGAVKYSLTEINYVDDDQDVDAEYTAEVSGCETSVEILRSVPQNSGYTLDEKAKAITFDVSDPDSAVTEVTAKATDKKTNAAITLTPEKADGDNYMISLSALGESKYDIVITVSYDLDSDKGNDQNNGMLTINKELDFSVTYLASLSGLEVTKVDASSNNVTLKFNANITANGSSTTKVKIQDVTVDGQLYAVKANGDGTYMVQIPYEGDAEQTIMIESFTLTNGLSLSCNSDNSVTIFKPAPTVSGLMVTESNGVVKAQFKLTDTAKIISGLKAVLRDGSGMIETKEFTDIPGDGNVNVTFDYSAVKAGTYTVSVLATFDRLDGAAHNDDELASGSTTVDIKSAVKAHSGVSQYVEKGAYISMTLTVEDNTDEKVSAFVIDENTVNAAPADKDGQYTVALKAPETAGAVTFKATKAVYGGRKIDLTEEYSAGTEVLKSAPTITGYTLDAENYKISFNVVDDDDALMNGKAIIRSKVSEQQVCTITKAGEQSFDIPEALDADTDYEVIIKLTYDLDSDKKADSDNYTADREVCNEPLELERNIDIEISDIKVTKVDKDAKTANITFTADGDERRRINRIFVDNQEQEYTAEYDEETDTYTVEDIPYSGGEDERQIVMITKFFVETGIEFDLTEKNVSFVLFKTEPTVENIEVAVNDENVYVQFEISDEDKTVFGLRASITKSTFNEIYGNTTTDTIDTAEVKLENGKYSVKLKLQDIKTAYSFNVNILADYDLADGSEHIGETVGVRTANVKIRSMILRDSVSDADDEDDLGGDAIPETVQRGDKLRLAFEIADNAEWDASRMVIDGVVYNLSKDRPTDDGDIYFADVKVPDKTGKVSFGVTKLYYGDYESEVNYKTAEINILKQKPGVKDYEDNGTANEPHLSFTFDDPDGAMTSKEAIFTLVKEDDKQRSGGQEVYRQELTHGEKVDIDLSGYDEGIYEVVIKASYNVYEEAAKEVRDVSLLADEIFKQEKRIQIKKGYNFKTNITPVEVFNDDMPFMFMAEIQSLTSENEIVSIDLKKATVNQETGEVTITDYKDGYMMPYSYNDVEYYNGMVMGWTYERGITYVYYDKAKLDNGEELLFDRYSSYSLVNAVPEVVKNTTTLREDVAKDCVNASTTIIDTDSTINRLRFRLKAANNRILDEKILNKEKVANYIAESNGKIDVTFDKEMPMTSMYKLDIIAEYDLMGRGDYYTSTLATASCSSAERLVIREHMVQNSYPEKGEDVVLGYRIAHNLASGIGIVGMRINGEEVELSEQEGDIYKFIMPAPITSGVYDYTATAVTLSTKTYNLDKKEPDENGVGGYNHQPTDQVDVLKDVPYVTDIRLEDNIDDHTATFTFNVEDPDGALNESSAGTAVVGGNTVNIEKGKNVKKFSNIAKDQQFEFNVIGNYDLDTNELKNEETSKNAYSRSILDGEQGIPFMLLDDYGLEIKNLKALGSNGEEETFFDKGSSFEVTFNGKNNSPSEIDRVVVDGKTYDVERNEEDGTFKTKLSGFTKAGKMDLMFDKVILANGKELEAKSAGKPVPIEIRKDVVKIDKFRSSDDGTSMTLNINVNDGDGSLVGDELDVKITDASSGEQVKTVAIEPNKNNTVSFETTDSRKYNVSVTADYTRTEDRDDVQEDAEIYSKTVSLDSREIEMKEVLNVNLFKVDGSTNEKLESIEYDELNSNLKNYLVSVEMQDLPSYFSAIEGAELSEDMNTLTLKIAYEGAVDYSSNEANTENIEIRFIRLEDGKYAYEGSFAALMRKLKTLKDGESYTLTKNYDASTYSTDTASYYGDANAEFKGDLDGGGYSISNLTRPLFSKLESAEIKNLYIKNVTLSTLDFPVPASLAYSANTTQIESVHISNVKITAYSSSTNHGSSAGMISDVNNTRIKKSSVTGITFTNSYLTQYSGAIVRQLKGSSVIDNCYTEGRINSGWMCNGGIAGSAERNSVISNSISNVSVATYDKTKNAGIVGNSAGKLENNISLGTGTNNAAYKIYGGTINGNSSNNYQISDFGGLDNQTDDSKFKSVDSGDVDENFYKNTLNLSEEVWDMTGATADNPPKLRGNRNYNPYVPSYDRISKNELYDENKETAYNNLYKLAPFYDAEYILKDAENIQTSDKLNTKKINGVIPYDDNDEIVYVLDKKNYDKIKKITIVYDDLSMEDHEVTFDLYFGDVVCYDIDDLKLKYNFNHYVIDSEASVIDELTDYIISKGRYLRALDTLTAAKDYDTYAYYYDEKLCNKESIREFVTKVLANCGYAVTGNNSNVNAAIRTELMRDNKLLNMLYAYNYFKRWYSFNIGKFSMVDMLLFKGEIFSNMLTFDNLAAAVLTNPASTMKANATDSFYASYISSYTGIKTLPDFLEYFIGATDGYKQGDEGGKNACDWFEDNFSGVLVEKNLIPVEELKGKIKYDDVQYRAWEHLRVRSAYLLPLLNMPKNSTYILSYPTCIAMGSLRNYIRDPEDSEQMASFMNSINSWANTLQTMYSTYFGILSSGEIISSVDLFNSKHDCIYDNTLVYETKDAVGRTWANARETQEPHMKWFAVPMGVNYYHTANFAVAGGKDIWYAQGNYFSNMYLYSHEGAHNQDGTVYFKGKGRRTGAGGEHFTTNMFSQQFLDGTPQFNVVYNESENANISYNIKPERVNTVDKIEDFYKKMFDTSYFLDYLMGEAFLKLNSDQQSAIACQWPETITEFKANKVDKATIESMKLETVEDLVENRLVLGHCNTQSLYDVRWADCYSTTSLVDATQFHYNGYQMLAYAGYDKGFIQYCANIYKNDLEALQGISKAMNENDGRGFKDFTEFKKATFKRVAGYKDQLSYFNADEIIEEFKEALIKDSEVKQSNAILLKNINAAKKKYYLLLKSYTDDFRGEVFQEKNSSEVNVSNAKEFVEQITKNKYAHIKITQDLDFSGYTTGSNIIGMTFLGEIDGQDHNLKNLSRPLFKSLGENVKISNLTLKDAEIKLDYEGAGALSRAIDNVTVSNVRLDNVTVNSGNKNNIGALFGSAVNSTLTNIKASNVTISGGKNAGGIVGILTGCTVTNNGDDKGKAYTVNVTGNDYVGGYAGVIENTRITGTHVSNVTLNGKSYVGGLVGNAIDSTIKEAAVEIVDIKDARNNVGGLVGNLTGTGTAVEGKEETSHSELSDSYARDVEITAVTKVGGTVGNADKSSIIKTSSSAKANISGTGDSIGGFIGEINTVTISDCYSAGATVHGKNYIGGFAGYTTNPKITNCYSHGVVTSTQKGRGGFIGTARKSGDFKPELKNNIAFVNVGEEFFKFDPDTSWDIINNGYSNNYEVEEYPGLNTSSRPNITADHFPQVKISGINSNFFTSTLSWTTEIWSFNNVESGGLPMLTGKGNSIKDGDSFTFRQAPTSQQVLTSGD